MWMSIALVAVTLAVFAPVRNYGFIALDDPLYVSENPHVSGGLTWEGVTSAFTSTRGGFRIPLVWLSYMAEVECFGPGAGPHHVTNVILHIANCLLLFGLLRRMTGATGRSAVVAALFAVHPLHVESVAWVTERKDVLSTLFLMLAIRAYVEYVRRPGRVRYLVVSGAFALGLMAKPMIVTLPFLLLLLDVWPLGRLSPGAEAGRKDAVKSGANWPRLILEKLPLLAMAAVTGAITVLAQRATGAMSGLEAIPVGLRVENALVSYVAYIGQMVWPAGLSGFYALPAAVSAWKAAAAALALALVTAAAVRAAPRRPYLFVGWFWYLIALSPVIGILQAGLQARADRFTYVPLVGLFIMVAWGVPDMVSRLSVRRGANRVVLPAAAAMAILACAVSARAQVRYWSDSVAFWTRALEVTLSVDSYRAHMALGAILQQQDRLDEAIGHFSEAARLRPDSAEAQHGLGLSLGRQGKVPEAVAALMEAVRLKPGSAEAQRDLGFGLSRQGRTADAVAHYEEAIRLKPGLPDVHNNLGVLLGEQGRMAEALPHFAEAARLKPDFEQARLNLAIALAQTGRPGEALAEFREVLRINPDNAMARRAVMALLR